MAKVLDRKNQDCAREIDKSNGIKNCFRWAWLDSSVTVQIGTQTVTTCLTEHIRKVDVPGKVLCILFSDMINYGNRGARNIQEHIKTKKHKVCSSKSEKQQHSARSEDGRLLYDGEWYSRGQTICIDKKDEFPTSAIITTINHDEVWFKRSDGSKSKLYISQLQKGKYTIKHA